MIILTLTKPTNLRFLLTEHTLFHRDTTCNRKRWIEKKKMFIWMLLPFDVMQRNNVDTVFSNFRYGIVILLYWLLYI